MSSRCPVTLSLALNRQWSDVFLRCNYGNAFPSTLTSLCTKKKKKEEAFVSHLQLLPKGEDSIAGLFWLKQARKLTTCFASRQYKGVKDRWKCQNISRRGAIKLDSSPFGILKWDVKDNSLAIIPFFCTFPFRWQINWNLKQGCVLFCTATSHTTHSLLEAESANASPCFFSARNEEEQNASCESCDPGASACLSLMMVWKGRRTKRKTSGQPRPRSWESVKKSLPGRTRGDDF